MHECFIVFDSKLRQRKTIPPYSCPVDLTACEDHFKDFLLKYGVTEECFPVLCLQVNGTEIEYEFEEITLERVSVFIFPQQCCA